jgi:hypothetical protein
LAAMTMRSWRRQSLLTAATISGVSPDATAARTSPAAASDNTSHANLRR